MKYIGRKYVSSIRRKKVKTTSKYAKSKKKTKKVVSGSDWAEYCGSNKYLLADISKYGKENFSFHIICWCYTKGQCNYIEEWLQFKYNALLDQTYYNNSIGARGYIALANNGLLFEAIKILDAV